MNESETWKNSNSVYSVPIFLSIYGVTNIKKKLNRHMGKSQLPFKLLHQKYNLIYLNRIRLT